MSDIAPNLDQPEVSFYRSNHIRGLADEELTPELYYRWGRSLGRLSKMREDITVASDCRESSSRFKSALIDGFSEAGVSVFDLGAVPHLISLSTMLHRGTAGYAFVSGFDYPHIYNGLCWNLLHSKLTREQQVAILRYEAEHTAIPPCSTKERGIARPLKVVPEWIEWHRQIWHDTPKVPFRILLDPLHGTWSNLLRPALQVIFPAMTFESLHDSPEPDFGGLKPNCRDRESLSALCTEVVNRKMDMGFALDGDSGCFTLVDQTGVPFDANELCFLVLRSFFHAIHREKIVHTACCPEALLKKIQYLGGIPILSSMRTDAFYRTMKSEDAALGIDHRGRFYARFCRGYYITMFAIAWLLDYLSRDRLSLTKFRQELPKMYATQELTIPWAPPETIVSRLGKRWKTLPEPTPDGFQFRTEKSRLHFREIRDYALLGFQFESEDEASLLQTIDQCAASLEESNLAVPLLETFQNC